MSEPNKASMMTIAAPKWLNENVTIQVTFSRPLTGHHHPRRRKTGLVR